MTIALIYKRISVAEVVAGVEEASTARQERRCRAWIASQGWTVGGVFTDVDKSAHQRVRRDGYEALLREVDAHRGDVVVAWRLDRLVRRPEDFEKLLVHCGRAGVNLRSVTEPIDAFEPIGLAIARVMVLFAQLEGDVRSIRLANRHRDHAELGLPPRVRPYGLTAMCDGIVEDEAAIIREAAGRVLTLEPVRSIVADLKARGVLTRRGVPFSNQSLRTALTHRSICGDSEYRGEVAAAGCWPVIVDPLVAAQVRHVLAPSRQGTATGASRLALLTGMLSCSLCGHPMTPRQARYVCNGCSRLSVGRVIVESWTVAAVASRLRGRGFTWARRPWDQTQVNLAIQALDRETDVLRCINRAYWFESVITRTEWTRMRDLIALTTTQAIARLPMQRPEGLDPAVNLNKLAEHWSSIPAAVQREIVRLELGSIVVHPNPVAGKSSGDERFEVTWVRPDPPRWNRPAAQTGAKSTVQWLDNRKRPASTVLSAAALRKRGGPLTAAEASRITGLSYAALQYRGAAGEITRTMSATGQLMFDLQDLDRWMKTKADYARHRASKKYAEAKRVEHLDKVAALRARRAAEAEAATAPISMLVYRHHELAAELGLSTTRLSELVRLGVIPHLRLAERILYPRASVTQWLNDQRHRTVSDPAPLPAATQRRISRPARTPPSWRRPAQAPRDRKLRTRRSEREAALSPESRETATSTRVRVPNAERSMATRRRIQTAAVERFYRHGYVRTTVDDIVKKAGVTKGAFYHHFRSKDEVLVQIQEDLLNQQLDHFEGIVRSHDTASERLAALVTAIVRTVVEDRAAVTVWTRENDNLEPRHRTALLALRDKLDTVIADTISAGMASGEFRQTGDARALAFGIVGMCTWVQEWFSKRGELSVDEIAELYGRLLLDGLRAD